VKGGKLGVEEAAGGLRIGHSAANQQLRHDGRNARRTLERRDPCWIVRGESANASTWGVLSNSCSAKLKVTGQIPLGAPLAVRANYFFFSVCSVCFRSRGEYFFNVSFSPPGFRRIV